MNQNADTDICHCKSPRDFIFTKITNSTGQDPLMEASEVLSFFLYLVTSWRLFQTCCTREAEKSSHPAPCNFLSIINYKKASVVNVSEVKVRMMLSSWPFLQNS